MTDPEFHRDRREHGGAPQRLDDDLLADIAEDERVDAGLDDYNPDEVPPATDPLPPDLPTPRPNVREGNEYQEEQAEIRREEQAGELRDPDEADPFPPTRYDNSLAGCGCWARHDFGADRAAAISARPSMPRRMKIWLT